MSMRSKAAVAAAVGAVTFATAALPQEWGNPNWPGWGGGWGGGWGWQQGPGTNMGPGMGMGPGIGMAPGMGMGPGMGMSPGMGMGPGMGMMPGRGQFAAIDADQDGTVSAEEAASHADAVFSAMDKDDDGTLTLDEFMAVRMGMPPGGGMNEMMEGRMQAMKEQRFAPMDANGDGAVSKEEFLTAARTHFEAAGQGGAVTPWTYRFRNWN